MPGRHVNQFRISYSNYEFRIILDEEFTSALNFVLTPSLVKVLSKDLAVQIKEYEKKYAEIKTDDIIDGDGDAKTNKNSYT